MKAWRYLALVLLAANLLLVVLRALVPPQVPAEPEPPPPDPTQPELALVREALPAHENGERCYTIGPLASRQLQEQAKDRLEPFAVAIRLRTTTADRDRGWWVYLPAASDEEARELDRELTRRGVDEHYVVSGGEPANAVSLGRFESLNNARNRQARLRALGFDARLSIRREETTRFWIDYRLPEDERSPWRFILRTSPGARHFEIPCGWREDELP